MVDPYLLFSMISDIILLGYVVLKFLKFFCCPPSEDIGKKLEKLENKLEKLDKLDAMERELDSMGRQLKKLGRRGASTRKARRKDNIVGGGTIDDPIGTVTVT